MRKGIIQNGYVDRKKNISQKYHDDSRDSCLVELPEDLKPYQEHVFKLIDSVYSDAKLPEFEDDRGSKTNPFNSNFEKKEFKELWNRINRKAAFSVHFDSDELIEKCIKALDSQLRVSPLQYTVQRGDQADHISYDQMKSAEGFKVQETSTEYSNHSIHSSVKYAVVENFGTLMDVVVGQ